MENKSFSLEKKSQAFSCITALIRSLNDYSLEAAALSLCFSSSVWRPGDYFTTQSGTFTAVVWLLVHQFEGKMGTNWLLDAVQAQFLLLCTHLADNHGHLSSTVTEEKSESQAKQNGLISAWTCQTQFMAATWAKVRFHVTYVVIFGSETVCDASSFEEGSTPDAGASLRRSSTFQSNSQVLPDVFSD